MTVSPSAKAPLPAPTTPGLTKMTLDRWSLLNVITYQQHPHIHPQNSENSEITITFVLVRFILVFAKHFWCKNIPPHHGCQLCTGPALPFVLLLRGD